MFGRKLLYINEPIKMTKLKISRMMVGDTYSNGYCTRKIFYLHRVSNISQ